MAESVQTHALDPTVERRAAEPSDGVALSLSGGGYRAMLFHAGTVLRLNELGALKSLKRISSVSGGSLTAGVLGLVWKHLRFDEEARATNLPDLFLSPLLALSTHTIDWPASLEGLILPWTNAGERVEAAYRSHLFGDATLQDLPSDAEGPRFVINATNVQTGVLFRFSRPYAGDYLIGRMKEPRIPLALAVAASSAFPPVLSPVRYQPHGVTWMDPVDPTRAALREKIYLTDGGVYDNLGLETTFKEYRTLIVSDAGQDIDQAEVTPHTDWPLHALRVLDIIDNQVRSLRTRILVDAFIAKTRTGRTSAWACWRCSQTRIVHVGDRPLVRRVRAR